MRKFWSLLLTLGLLMTLTMPVWSGDAPQEPVLSEIGAAYGFANSTLEAVLNQFMEENGLDEDNFSMSCYLTGTGELFSFAGDTFRVAASTYKLPLNMVYYDMERQGKLSPDTYIDGYSLSTMHYETIVNSNNDMAISMLYNLGSFRTYREIMTQFYDQDYPSVYYAGNNINSDYMLAVLWKLYCCQEDYPELLDNMKAAAYGQYFQLYQGEYEIAHKYGYFEGAVNDVGIIYTPEPILVAAYTEQVGYAESKLGALAELLTEYSVYRTQQKAAQEAREKAEREAEAKRAAEERAEAESAAAMAAAAEEQEKATAQTPERPESAEVSALPEAPESAQTSAVPETPENSSSAGGRVPVLVIPLGLLLMAGAVLLRTIAERMKNRCKNS